MPRSLCAAAVDETCWTLEGSHAKLAVLGRRALTGSSLAALHPSRNFDDLARVRSRHFRLATGSHESELTVRSSVSPHLDPPPQSHLIDQSDDGDSKPSLDLSETLYRPSKGGEEEQILH